MDINTYIRQMANIINESRTDWETGEDDYDAEEEFKADAEYQGDKEKSERKLASKTDLEKDGEEKTKNEAMSIDDILKMHADMKAEEARKQAELDKTKVGKVEIDSITIGGETVDSFNEIYGNDTADVSGRVVMKDGSEKPFAMSIEADDVMKALDRLNKMAEQRKANVGFDEFDAVYAIVRKSVDPEDELTWWYAPTNKEIAWVGDEIDYEDRSTTDRYSSTFMKSLYSSGEDSEEGFDTAEAPENTLSQRDSLDDGYSD